MATDLNNLTSPIRQLHDAMAARLAQTFPNNIVRAHATKVDAETIRTHSVGQVAIWPVIADATGMSESDANLVVDVTWGIFIAAGPLTTKSGTVHTPVPAYSVVEHLAALVARQAFRTNWGVDKAIVGRVPPTSIKVQNLGVAGVKANKSISEGENLGLYVVWGCNQVCLGPQLAPGDPTFDKLKVIYGDIVDDGPGSEAPSIKVRAVINTAFSALPRGLWGALVGGWRKARRWVLGPSWAEQAADIINSEIAHART